MTWWHDAAMTAISQILPDEHPATRSVRVRRKAADRASRWRERQRETAETDAAIVKAILQEMDAYVAENSRLYGKESHVDTAYVVGRAAMILGGMPRFKEAKARVFKRLAELAPPPKG